MTWHRIANPKAKKVKISLRFQGAAQAGFRGAAEAETPRKPRKTALSRGLSPPAPKPVEKPRMTHAICHMKRRLRREADKAADIVEMAVVGYESRAGFERGRGDPDVVLGDWGAFFRERGFHVAPSFGDGLCDGLERNRLFVEEGGEQ